LRVAIVHDYLTQRGGAERVVLSLHRLFPDAPIFTSVYDADGTYGEFRTAEVHWTFLQRLPHHGRAVRALLPLYPFAFSRRLEGYDVVISSSSGWAHGVTAPDGVHICYCHTPARWLYQTDRYLVEGSPVPRWARPVLGPVLSGLRRWDRSASRHPDAYVANSRVTADRIQFIYGRPARVVHPAIEYELWATPAGPPPVEQPYYLVCSRLLPYKRVDLAIEACQQRGARLVIVGQGPAWGTLRELAGPLVEFRPGVSDLELAALRQGCIAQITSGEEDFGLAPLEANAAGRPVAVYAVGGALETVVDERTGVLFHQPDAGSLAAALDRIERTVWDSDAIRRHACGFREDRFHEGLLAVVDDVIASRRRR
jgi:glycosyltransferase involved in cell wall biosynthesis